MNLDRCDRHYWSLSPTPTESRDRSSNLDLRSGTDLSQDLKEDLAREFQPILNGRGINLKEYTGNLEDLTVHDVMEDTKVSVENTPAPFGTKVPKENNEGFCKMLVRKSPSE